MRNHKPQWWGWWWGWWWGSKRKEIEENKEE